MRRIIRAVGSIAVVLAMLGTALTVLSPPAGASPAGPVGAVEGFQPPVDAPVVDPFRPPTTQYGPGNRGLEYGTAPGSPVVASRRGLVVYSGWVGGTQHITVLHDDGLRSTYSFLSSRLVGRGDRVVGGQAIAVAGPGFHFGIRDGDNYIDPAAMFLGAPTIKVRLIPSSEPLPPWDLGRANERRGIVAAMGGLVGGAADLMGDGVDLFVESIDYVDEKLDEVERFVVDLALNELRQYAYYFQAFTLAQWLRMGYDFYQVLTGPCSDGGIVDAVVPPPERRVALLVGGLGSSAADAAIDALDTETLGYERGDVLRYSYDGGRVPGPVSSEFNSLVVSDYGPDDTMGDINAEGVALADLVEQAARQAPDVPIDLFAHSMGGLVTRIALRELEDRNLLGVLGNVVTIATPNIGAPLGNLARSFGPISGTVLDSVTGLIGDIPDTGSEAVEQVSEFSDFVIALRLAGVPNGVNLRTIGARGDLVVPSVNAGVQGVPDRIVDTMGFDAHDAVVSDPQTTEEIGLALAGRPPKCESLANAVADVSMGEAVKKATDAAGVVSTNYAR